MRPVVSPLFLATIAAVMANGACISKDRSTSMSALASEVESTEIMACFSHEEFGPMVTVSIRKLEGKYFALLKNTHQNVGTNDELRRNVTYNLTPNSKSLEILIHAKKQNPSNEVLMTSGVITGKIQQLSGSTYVSYQSKIQLKEWDAKSYEITCAPQKSTETGNSNPENGGLSDQEKELVAAYKKVIEAGPRSIVQNLESNKIDAAKRMARFLFVTWQTVGSEGDLFNRRLAMATCKDMTFVCRNNLDLSAKEIKSLYFDFVKGSMSNSQALRHAKSIVEREILESVPQ